jgi:hypothetical protein
MHPAMATIVTYASWSAARLEAFAIVIVVLLLLICVGAVQDKWKVGGLVNGMDNRWSTSKISVGLWTLAVLWAFIALLIRYGGAVVPSSVPPAYFALLGIPGGAALGAKAITSSSNTAKTFRPKPTTNPLAGLGQVFANDGGSVDLLDSQYFLFNLVLLAYFVAGFFHVQVLNGTEVQLPTLPGSLLALAGISAVTYLGKKALPGGPTQASTVTEGSSLHVDADSYVSFPGGGEVTLASPGAITIYPGVTYETNAIGSVKAAAGGSFTCNAQCRLKVGKAATITAPPGTRVIARSDTTALVSNGSQAVGADGAEARDAGDGLGKSLASGSTVTFANAGEMILTGDAAAELELPAEAVVSYFGTGSIEVSTGAVHATVNAGATLSQRNIANVGFPQGATFVDAIVPGPAQTVGEGESVPLKAGTQGTLERSIALVQDAEVVLPSGTEVSFPAVAAPVAGGVKATAASVSTIELPSGGEVKFDKTPGEAARVPAGSTVSVPPGEAGASVTATVG